METFSIVDNINVNLLNKKIAEFAYKEGYDRIYLRIRRHLIH